MFTTDVAGSQVLVTEPPETRKLSTDLERTCWGPFTTSGCTNFLIDTAPSRWPCKPGAYITPSQPRGDERASTLQSARSACYSQNMIVLDIIFLTICLIVAACTCMPCFRVFFLSDIIFRLLVVFPCLVFATLKCCSLGSKKIKRIREVRSSRRSSATNQEGGCRPSIPPLVRTLRSYLGRLHDP